MADLYNDFLETLEEQNEKPVMTHLPSRVRLASYLFGGYLAEEELQERQYAGRYWDLVEDGYSGNGYDLFILLDNETTLSVTKSNNNGKFVEAVYNRPNVALLPNSLRGMHYN